MNSAQIIGWSLGGGGVVGAIASIVTPVVRSLFGRPLVKAEATAKITTAAMALIDQAQEEVAQMRTERAQMRAELVEITNRMRAAEFGLETAGRRAAEAGEKLRQIIALIHADYMTLPILRQRVPPLPTSGTNGRDHS